MKKLVSFGGIILGIVITLVFSTVKLYTINQGKYEEHFLGFIQNIENSLLDFMIRLRGQPTTPRQIEEFQKNAHVVIAAVDEKSVRMKDLGLWPWPRVKMAKLIHNLEQCGARVIGFDMVFAEPDISRSDSVVQAITEHYKTLDSPDPAFLKYLRDYISSTSGDARMAQELEKYENIVLGYFFFTDSDQLAELDKEDVIERGMESIGFGTFGFVKAFPGENVTRLFPQAFGVRANLPQFTDSVDYYGFFNQIPSPDGVYRLAPLVFAFVPEKSKKAVEEGKEPPLLFPSLSLQVLSAYYGQPAELFAETLDGKRFLEDQIFLFLGPLGQPSEEHLQIPVENKAMFRVNYYGGPRTFRHVSAGDIIHGDKKACVAVKDKIVLVGATTTGIYDLRPTPFDASFPGVEIHASIIENVITGNYLHRDIDSAWLEAIMLLLLGVFLSWLLNKIRLTIGLVIVILLIAGMVLGNFFYFFAHGMVIQLVMPVAEIFFLFAGISVWRYSTEEKQKRETRRAFQHYLSKDVIDTVLNDISRLGLGGERRELTVLFSDIRGFTTISEGLAPEELTGLLNEYLTPMTDLVFKYRGTLDKYMGDAIMAFFGAPLKLPDHAKAACWSAIEMMEKLEELRRGWRNRGLPELDIGIGINTGIMSVGNMGSVNRFDYTVMGDHVNLGSRLEGINKVYKSHIIISEYTRQAIGDHFTCRELDSVAVKGKKEPVRIFELVHRGPKTMEDAWIDVFHEALAAYRAQKWDEAMEIFLTLVAQRNDPTSEIFVQRCKDMKEIPPGENWDGVLRMKTK